MKTINIDGVEYVKKSDIKLSSCQPASAITRLLRRWIGSIPEISNGYNSNPFFIVGNEYFIRTVTHYFTGRLVWVGEKEIAIEDAAWIADTGRFNEFVAGKTVSEVEPFPKGVVIVGRGAIIDMSERVGGLLLKVK